MSDAPRWTPLHAQLHRTLRSRSLLPKQQRLLVAVSGGQDSLCLIRLLLDLQPKWGWHLAIAHCDHRWRSDSAANADYVEQLAQGWSIPCYRVTTSTVPASEASAREWRYQALTDLALRHSYTHVLTGHTASDRAETLLYNLMRGSGMNGLAALVWQRPIAPGVFLVRPLLEITRSETAQFCQDACLQVWDDATNFDLQYARNRIRQELLPYLEAHFNPQVTQALTQTAEILQAEDEYLEQAAAALWQQVVEPKLLQPAQPQFLKIEAVLPKLDRLRLRQAPLALQRRLIRQVLQTVLPSAPQFEHIEKLVALITAPNRSQTDPFPGRVIAQVVGNWIVLQRF
ncbi:MAG: tRNA lysidine(34) synthetase TilS [Elainellaceae cyanobacterium]